MKLDFLAPEALAPRLRLHKVISPEKDKLETLYNLLCTLGYHPLWYSAIIVKAWSVLLGT